MSPIATATATATPPMEPPPLMDRLNATPSSDDLSALAWVHGEIHRSLDAAHHTLRRVLQAARSAEGADPEALDPAVIRAARQQVHQGIGALELAGLPAGALLLRASETLIQTFTTHPQNLHERAVQAVEAASFALLDLMRRRLAGKSVSGMALYPQYEKLTQLAGGPMARPSDLWVQEWQPVSLDAAVSWPASVAPTAPDEHAVRHFETALLALLRGGQLEQARSLVDLCSGLAVHAAARHAHREASTWTLAAGFLEALADGRLGLTVHVKRVLSALLGQLRTLARHPGLPSDRLAQELLFFCAQAEPSAPQAPEGILNRLRTAFRLQQEVRVDLEDSPLGRFDPSWVAQAIKRVAAAKDAWSAVAGGDLTRLAQLPDHVQPVAESVRRLYPHGGELALVLTQVAQATAHGGQAPAAELAMEVATSLLYLDASLEEAEFEADQERERIGRLAERIGLALRGEPALPLEPWMESLYRRVSDRQTIGSVVHELRVSLGECEKRIDQFFRDPSQTQSLVEVPSQLQSMKGVLSVLGLDAASQAITRMRQDVESLVAPDTDLRLAALSGVHDRLASNLGALGFLVDMLGVQPQLAKTLFVLDAETGVLAPIMGRAGTPERSDVDPIAVLAQPAERHDLLASTGHADPSVGHEVPLLMPQPAWPVVASTTGLEDNDDMREIFLEEAREVLEAAQGTVHELGLRPDDLGPLTGLRRAFHTLKGSARMVGLGAFGEAAWAGEQLCNTWLASQLPASPAMVAFGVEAVEHLSAWVEDIAAHTDADRSPHILSAAAEAVRAVPVAPEGAEMPEVTEVIEAPAVVEEDPVKVIGDLQIGLPLFNIYLQEAEEQSRRLATLMAAWSQDPGQPVGDDAVALAHSLAGNSGAVGYVDLARLARALEHALERSNAAGRGDASAVLLFQETADEVRRLLHQFAAGFLKSPTEGLVERLEHHDVPVPPSPLITPALVGEGGVDLGEDADIDAVDTIDIDLFPVFEEEAQELLTQLAQAVRGWRGQPAPPEAGAICMRVLHTFKGGARLAGAMRLGELAHRMESVVERLAANGPPTPEALEALEARSDVLAEVFASLQRLDLRAEQEEVERVAAIGLAEAPAAPLSATPEPEPGSESAAVSGLAGIEVSQADVPSPGIDWSTLGRVFGPGSSTVPSEFSPATALVRVKARLLERLVNQAGEASISRSRLAAQVQQMRGSVGDLTDNLERLRQQLRDIELQAETRMGTNSESARAAQQDFDPLEFDRYTRFQEVTRMMAESVNDVATVQRSLLRNLDTAEDQLSAQFRLMRDLQDDLLRTRMVEFDGLSDRLYRVVRQAAKETGKQVRLDIVGGQTEVDRGVLDRMTGAFEHLLRNGVTHGIEAPEQRIAAGKDPQGTLGVVIRQEGNEIDIEFRDDGAGLDLAGIRRKALALQLLPPEGEVDDGELAQFIFRPGFSTAESVSELAGRGVGMDVVRAEVQSMGGRIETSTVAGQGTRFTLVLPLTTAVTQVVMVRCGDRLVAIPTTLVEMVRRVRSAEVQAAYETGVMAHGELSLPFHWLGALLQASPRGTVEGRSLPVLIVRSAQQRVALHVDEVLGHQDVVVKNLGPQLSRVPGLAGMTLLPSGTVALIHNPVALSVVHGEQARAWTASSVNDVGSVSLPAAQASVPQAPLVLVVDDSLTVRRVTQRLLAREGYRVALAKDGLDALEKMAQETPVVVLSDIEMPRMDGFDLARNLRSDPRWAQVPIVMITSRTAQKHRDYAMELGVDHYLGKPYREEELLGLVAGYAQAHAQAQAAPQDALSVSGALASDLTTA